MGKLTQEQIRKNMQANKSTGTKPELLLAKTLFARGHRYRKNDKSVFGTPDLTFKKIKLAIFVDGEFWHGKDWERRKHDHISNEAYWIQKIERNIEHDKVVNQELDRQGWTILRFWGGDVEKKPLDCALQIEGEAERLKRNFEQKISIETVGDKRFKIKLIEPDENLDVLPAHFCHRNNRGDSAKVVSQYECPDKTPLRQVAEDGEKYCPAKKRYVKYKNRQGQAKAIVLPDPDKNPDEFLSLFLPDYQPDDNANLDKKALMDECFRNFYRLVLMDAIEILPEPKI
ncbi:MAG: very short patch repair endonuclease [Dysgonamonadaceae bacterium]|jgi:DNA mismatch endonuclease Vsr|nr:very short patch repair endonuclease [Dysgonamonadaceae bacterium]